MIQEDKNARASTKTKVCVRFLAFSFGVHRRTRDLFPGTAAVGREVGWLSRLVWAGLVPLLDELELGLELGLEGSKERWLIRPRD